MPIGGYVFTTNNKKGVENGLHIMETSGMAEHMSNKMLDKFWYPNMRKTFFKRSIPLVLENNEILTHNIFFLKCFPMLIYYWNFTPPEAIDT